MKRTMSVGLAALVLLISACTTTQQLASTDFRPPEGNYRVIVMQPDISVGILTAGGTVEPREDWTKLAHENVLNALAEQQASRGAQVKIAATREDAGGNPEAVADLVWLHQAVGSSIRLHKYAMFPLPTKKNRMDWTLGQTAVEFGAQEQYDYALFLHARDSFASGGRAALQVAGVLTCFVGACMIPTGGQQIAFASLVDLKTGQVVWFNFLYSDVGDIRTPEGARQMVTTLLDKMRPGKAEQAKTKA